MPWNREKCLVPGDNRTPAVQLVARCYIAELSRLPYLTYVADKIISATFTKLQCRNTNKFHIGIATHEVLSLNPRSRLKSTSRHQSERTILHGELGRIKEEAVVYFKVSSYACKSFFKRFLPKNLKNSWSCAERLFCVVSCVV